MAAHKHNCIIESLKSLLSTVQYGLDRTKIHSVPIESFISKSLTLGNLVVSMFGMWLFACHLCVGFTPSSGNAVVLSQYDPGR